MAGQALGAGAFGALALVPHATFPVASATVLVAVALLIAVGLAASCAAAYGCSVGGTARCVAARQQCARHWPRPRQQCQHADPPALPPLALSGFVRLPARCQEILLVRLQRFVCSAAQASASASAFSRNSRPSERPCSSHSAAWRCKRAQVQRKPGRVADPDRLHKAVMHQLHPGAAAAQLRCAPESAAAQRIHATLGRLPVRPAASWCTSRAADAGLGDQLLVEPGAQLPLAHARRAPGRPAPQPASPRRTASNAWSTSPASAKILQRDLTVASVLHPSASLSLPTSPTTDNTPPATAPARRTGRAWCPRWPGTRTWRRSSTSCSATPGAKGRPPSSAGRRTASSAAATLHALHVEAGAQAVEEQRRIGVQAAT